MYERDNGAYQIIDGLQRVTTIRKYLGNYDARKKYLQDSAIVTGDDVQELIDIVKSLNDDAYLEKLGSNVSELSKKIITEYLENLDIKSDSYDFDKIFSNIYPLIGNVADISNYKLFEIKLKTIIDKLHNGNLIRSKEMNMIVYTGDEEELPNVFKNLNTGAKNLSSYEILASIWSSDVRYKVTNNITLKVSDVLNQLEKDSGLLLEVNADYIKENGVNLYEYCVGLSRLVTSTFKIFKTSNKNIGFELISTAFGLEVSKPTRLFKLLGTNKNDTNVIERNTKILNEFTEITLDILSAMENRLLNLFDTTNRNLYAKNDNYAFIHMFNSYFKQMYNLETNFPYELDNKYIDPNKLFDFKLVKRDNIKIKDINKKLEYVYLRDIINGFWSSHRQVSDISSLIKGNGIFRYDSIYRNSDSVTDNIDNIKFEVSTYIDEQFDKTIKTIPENNRLLLYAIHNFNKMTDETYRDLFKEVKKIDIEHIVAQYYFKNRTIAEKQKSNLMNLCVMPSRPNQSKKEQNLYQYREQNGILDLNDTYLEYANYPKKEMFEMFNLNVDDKDSEEDFIDAYDLFCTSRKNEYIKSILKIFGGNEVEEVSSSYEKFLKLKVLYNIVHEVLDECGIAISKEEIRNKIIKKYDIPEYIIKIPQGGANKTRPKFNYNVDWATKKLVDDNKIIKIEGKPNKWVIS